MLLTSLGWAEVLAGSRSAWLAAAGFLNAESTALHLFTLKPVFGSISLIRSHHLDKAKATRLLGVRIQHDRTVFNVAVLLEHTCNVDFRERRVNASDKEVRARVDCTFVIEILHARVAGRRWSNVVST